MLSVLLRRSTVAACRALHWASSSQRCWTPALTGVREDASAWSRFMSSTRLSFTERDSGQAEPPRVSGVSRDKLFQKNQTWDALFLVRNQHFHSSAVRLKKRVRPEPPPRELDLLRYDMKHLWESPTPALCLGFAGLIPFVFPSLFMAVMEVYYPQLAYAQLAYAASITSFLGGARWGFALPESSPAKPDWMNLSNSVVPPLLAWVTMMMSDSIAPATIMVIMSLGISLHYDLSLLPTYPSWFKALRAVLTVVAVLSLIGTLIMNGMFPEKNLL